MSETRSKAEVDRDKNAAALAHAVVRADRAEAAVERVRLLHKDEWIVTPDGMGGYVCAACGVPVESEPCDTIMAIDGEG